MVLLSVLIGLFTKYFLILMVVQGLLVGLIDASTFKRRDMKAAAVKARVIGLGSIALGIVLYAVRVLS